MAIGINLGEETLNEEVTSKGKGKKKVEKKSIEDVVKALDKDYGKGTIINFEGEAQTHEVIPTGNISIDYELLGIGGFAKKKLYMVKGWSGSNKTTLCGHLVANCQAQGGKVLYIDSEHAVDRTYFSQLGVNFNNKTFFMVQPANGEEGMNVALEFIRTGEIDLVIFDSDSMLIPMSMMDAKAGTQNIGKKAKLNSDNYPKLKAAIVENNTCLVTICQYRVDPGKMFGDNRVVPGGFAIEYIADVIIDLTRRLRKEGDETAGTNTTIKTAKNKTYIPYKEVIFDTIFGEGFDNLGDILNLGKKYGIWKLRAEVITYEDKKYPESEFRDMIVSNPEFLQTIKEQIIKSIKENKIVDDGSEDKETSA